MVWIQWLKITILGRLLAEKDKYILYVMLVNQARLLYTQCNALYELFPPICHAGDLFPHYFLYYCF